MKKSVIILLHLFFWGLIFSKAILIPFDLTETTSRHINYTIFLSVGFPLFFYFSYFYLAKFLQKRKMLFYFLGGLSGTGLLLFFFYKTGFNLYLLTLKTTAQWFLYGILFRFFIDYLQKDKEQALLSKQNLQSELALLRTQINPHFLFNSLHNIDTLITINPEKASDSLLKLSDMMRYMLYDADCDHIELSQEIKYLKQYVQLQQLRLSNPESVKLDIQLQAESVEIAPMLLVPFIENAFKHTTDKNQTHGISITIKQMANRIYFETINIFDEKRMITKDQTSGIGLANIKRRLELIYPNSHQLDIQQVNGLFIVKLTLETYAS